MIVLRLADWGENYSICEHIEVRGYYEQTVKKGVKPLSVGCEYFVTLNLFCKKCKKKYSFYVAVN